MSLRFDQVYLLTAPQERDSFPMVALGARTRTDDIGEMLQVITNDGLGGHGFRVREALVDDLDTGVVEFRDTSNIVWRFEPLTVEAFRQLEGYPDHLYRYAHDEELRDYFRDQFLHDAWTEME